MPEQIAANRLDDAPAHAPRKIRRGVVAEPAQQEQDRRAGGDEPQHLRVLLVERAVDELLDEQCQRAVGGREQRHAEHADEKRAAVRPRVADQAPEHTARRRGPRAWRGLIHFDGLDSSIVAMLIFTKPSLPSTSMAVTTDWVGAGRSARAGA